MSFAEDFYHEPPESPVTYSELPCYIFGFWRCKDGKLVRISEMETSHIINLERVLEKRGLDLPEPIKLELEFRNQEAL